MAHAIFQAIDLGENFIPMKINMRRDVLGRNSVPNPSPWSVHMANGTVIRLPDHVPGRPADTVAYVHDINDNGLVVCSLHNADRYILVGKFGLFDCATQTLELINVATPGITPGLFDVAPGAINSSGQVGGYGWVDLIGRIGFILNTSNGQGTLVGSFAADSPLFDLNEHGHAVGQRAGYPTYFNGSAPIPIGPPNQMGSAVGITDTNLVVVNFEGNYAIYNGKMNTLTPFTDGDIIDLNASRDIVWSGRWPALDTAWLTSGGTTTRVDQLFPAGSGWSSIRPTAMNDRGDIVGSAQLHGKSHGWLLVAGYRIPDMETTFARIIWGIINDGAGVQAIGGHLRRIPPYGPLRELLEALPQTLSHQLESKMRHTRFETPRDAQIFAEWARVTITGFLLQYRERH